MANLVVTRGLQRIAAQASQVTAGGAPTYSATRHIQTISIDDSSNAFAAGNNSLDAGGAVTNMHDLAVSAVSRSGQTVTHQATVAAGNGNFTIRRIALHDDTAANVSTSSQTLVSGIDGQSLVKSSDFTLTIAVDLTYSV